MWGFFSRRQLVPGFVWFWFCLTLSFDTIKITKSFDFDFLYLILISFNRHGKMILISENGNHEIKKWFWFPKVKITKSWFDFDFEKLEIKWFWLILISSKHEIIRTLPHSHSQTTTKRLKWRTALVTLELLAHPAQCNLSVKPP